MAETTLLVINGVSGTVVVSAPIVLLGGLIGVGVTWDSLLWLELSGGGGDLYVAVALANI